jgi:hypothetical protein
MAPLQTNRRRTLNIRRFNAMGQDIQDSNNDGLADVFELDMSPADNYRKKMMMMPNS